MFGSEEIATPRLETTEPWLDPMTLQEDSLATNAGVSERQTAAPGSLHLNNTPSCVREYDMIGFRGRS